MKATFLAVCVLLPMLLVASFAWASDLRDPVGGLLLPLDVAEAELCVVAPRAMRDPTACAGLQSVADGLSVAAVPGGTNLLTAVGSVTGGQFLLSVDRLPGRASQTDAVARQILAGLRRGVEPRARVVDAGSAEPTRTRVGDTMAARGVVRFEDLGDPAVPLRGTREVSVFPGRDCLYVVTLRYDTRAGPVVRGYEAVLLSGVSVDRRSSLARALDVSDAAVARTIGIAFAVGTLVAIVVVRALTRSPSPRRKRRRAKGGSSSATGDTLVVERGEALPPLCARCGTAGALVEQRFFRTVDVPFCRPCHRRWSAVTTLQGLCLMLSAVALAVCLILFFTSDTLARGALLVLDVVLGIGSLGMRLALHFTHAQGLRVEPLGGGAVRIRGAAPAMLRAVRGPRANPEGECLLETAVAGMLERARD